MTSEDMSYYEECLNAHFFLYKGKILATDLINLPNEEELDTLLASHKVCEIEEKYNHFHMSFISQNMRMQKKCALNIWEKWRVEFNRNFPSQQIEIQIIDNGHEIILSVYRHQIDCRINQK